MKKTRLILSLIAMILITSIHSGCTSTYTTIRLIDGKSPGKLSSDCSVYIMVPEYGNYGAAEYRRSGIMTANVIYGAFLRHIPRATISRKTGSYEEELLRAKDQGYTYLVQPEILHWEERATEWSGKSDRIKIRISIAEAETGNVIDSVIITGKSKWVTFGGDHPQDLLPTPINKYVVSLFR